MSYQSTEQAVHDKINLARLVRRLEKSVAEGDWENADRHATWVKARGTLQNIKHARKLLKNVELSTDLDSHPSSLHKFEELRRTVDRLEIVVVEVEKRVAPKSARPPPILPTLPLPKPSKQEPIHSTTLDDIPVDGSIVVAAQELLLSPSDTTPFLSGLHNPAITLLPPTLPTTSTSTASKPAPAFLQNSQALHDELSAQLAQMATQLKRNTEHFASSLEKDKGVMLAAQEKLERNFDVMSKERVRLRDHHGKSWGTTWLVMLSLVIVLIAFIMTFLVIRVT